MRIERHRFCSVSIMIKILENNIFAIVVFNPCFTNRRSFNIFSDVFKVDLHVFRMFIKLYVPLCVDFCTVENTILHCYKLYLYSLQTTQNWGKVDENRRSYRHFSLPGQSPGKGSIASHNKHKSLIGRQYFSPQAATFIFLY